MAAISVVSPWAILAVKGSQLTSNAIPVIAVFLLFAVVALAQPLLRLLSRRFAFGRAELITVYVMMLAGSVVVTTGLTGSFLSVISGAVYYATPENNWETLFWSPSQPLAVPAGYRGGAPVLRGASPRHGDSLGGLDPAPGLLGRDSCSCSTASSSASRSCSGVSGWRTSASCTP